MQDDPSALRFEDPGIKALFTQDARWQSWIDVEVALARAEAELGMIPADAARVIAEHGQLSLLDQGRIQEGLLRTGHPLVPLIWEFSRVVGEEAGGYVHWPLTEVTGEVNGRRICLSAWMCEKSCESDIRLSEHKDFRWLEMSEMSELKSGPLDKEIVKFLSKI